MGKILFSLVSLVVAGVILFMYTQPKYEASHALQAQDAAYTQALQKAAELQALKQKLLSTYNSFDTNELDRLNKALPDHVDNVRLILDLDSLATKHGIGLQNVSINAPSNQSDSSNSGTINSVASQNTAYDSLLLKFSARGTYDNFLSFMNDLETSLRVVDLVSLEMSIDSSAVGNTASYKYDISIRTYWLK